MMAIAPWFRALTALAEDLGSVLITHRVMCAFQAPLLSLLSFTTFVTSGKLFSSLFNTFKTRLLIATSSRLSLKLKEKWCNKTLSRAGEMAQWVRAPDCSSEGPEFKSQQPHGGSQPSVTRSDPLF
jgi:ABC-type bacteriocin/lantibiotic exporter with double-glycine peptidase domain